MSCGVVTPVISSPLLAGICYFVYSVLCYICRLIMKDYLFNSKPSYHGSSRELRWSKKSHYEHENKTPNPWYTSSGNPRFSQNAVNR